jgi:aerobic-type carbon monoxide dehydrogenase small subunit (CoxS/CutS family)
MPVLTINEKNHEVNAEEETPLLRVIRDVAGLTGVRYGCGIGLWGGVHQGKHAQPVSLRCLCTD